MKKANAKSSISKCKSSTSAIKVEPQDEAD